MKANITAFSARYRRVLQAHLKKAPEGTCGSAHILGRDGLKMGLLTIDLAKIHESVMGQMGLPDSPSQRNGRVAKREDLFFDEVIVPYREAYKRLGESNGALTISAAELALANKSLKGEIARHKSSDVALKKSELHHRLLLDKSRKQQEQLRYLSHQILIENEEQRKQISRELHDEIAQILAGINVHLAALKVEAVKNTKGLTQKIASTQRLIEKSMKIVRRFATELRPTVLDDLGIIPALKTYVNDFTARTGTQVVFTAFPKVEELNSTKRTVLFRVAQAALANITQHAKATRVRVTIKKYTRLVCMEIHDNGQAFDVERALHSRMNEHLGLIGMRERVEMVGGNFSVESAPGKGTTICAEIPSIDSHKKKPPVTEREKLLLI